MISHTPGRASEFDLAVVGGGALGCALAWEASSRKIRRARAYAFERWVLLRIAPHLVRPFQCMLPTRRSLLRGRRT